MNDIKIQNFFYINKNSIIKFIENYLTEHYSTKLKRKPKCILSKKIKEKGKSTYYIPLSKLKININKETIHLMKDELSWWESKITKENKICLDKSSLELFLNYLNNSDYLLFKEGIYLLD